MIATEGLPRLWRRPDAERGGPAREIQARAETLDFAALPRRAETRLAGLLLVVPDLIELGVPDMRPRPWWGGRILRYEYD